MKDKIRTLRLRAGLTQAQLAEKLIISPSAVAAWETGARNPKIEHLRKMADLFHVSLSELTGDAPAPRPVQTDAPPAAGTEIIQTDDGQRLAIISTQSEKKNAFIQPITDMEPDIQAGDVVIYDPDASFASGDVVAFDINGTKAAFAMLLYKKVGVILTGKNLVCGFFVSEDIKNGSIKALGKVTEIRRSIQSQYITTEMEITKTKDESAPI